jgi:hypothetical protein
VTSSNETRERTRLLVRSTHGAFSGEFESVALELVRCNAPLDGPVLRRIDGNRACAFGLRTLSRRGSENFDVAGGGRGFVVPNAIRVAVTERAVLATPPTSDGAGLEQSACVSVAQGEFHDRAPDVHKTD